MNGVDGFEVGEITIQPVRNYINNPLDKWFSVELTSAFYFHSTQKEMLKRN